MCLLVTKCRSVNLTKSALEQIVIAHGLFTKVASRNSVLSQMQELMNKLHNLAHAASNRMYYQRTVITELDRLGGKTRLISSDGECQCPYTTPIYADANYVHLQSSQTQPQHQNQHQHPPQAQDQTQTQTQPSQSTSNLSADASLLLNIPQNAHPTLTQGIMNFESLGESLNNTQELYDTPTAENIRPYEGDQWRFITCGGHDPVSSNGTASMDLGNFPADAADALTLDSTWQNFVQELGINDFIF